MTAHVLLQSGKRVVTPWVLFCSRHNPDFRPIPPPANQDKPDYRYIPAQAAEELHVVPEAIGLNPMDDE